MSDRNISERELPPVLFIPGSVYPAADSYGKLVYILKNEIEFIMKDHDIYAVDAPSNWRLGIEVEGLSQFANAMGFDTFHIVGYSFGASLALAFASKHLHRLRSMTLIEPDWIGNIGISTEETKYHDELKMIFHSPPEKFLEDFMRLKVCSDVKIPRLETSYDLEKRAVGLRAFLRGFEATELLYGKFSTFTGPVYIALGDQSNPVEIVKAKRLKSAFPKSSVNVYEGCHHWAPPQMSQPERFAAAMLKLWSA